MVRRFGRALGFTLIEMAIVLVVIGLIMSGGLLAVAPVIQNSKFAETNQKLDRIEQALILHVIRHSCLPCPAAPGVDSAVAANNAGQAVANTTGAYLTGCNANPCTNTMGAVPWVNLDLSETDVTDGFGTRISYALAPNNTLQVADSMRRSIPSTYPVGDLEVRNIGGTTLTSAAAYVLISHGANRDGGFLAQVGGATAIANPYGTTPEAGNADGTEPFIQDDYVSTKDTGYFDDVVRWRTAPMIIQFCGNGACGNP